MIKKFALGLLVFVGALVLIGFLLPSTYAVERSVTIKAQPQAIHAYVGDLRKWPDWTAWNLTKFPDMKYSYEGDPTAVGGAQVWSGESSGNGRLSITSTDAATGLDFLLDFEQGKYVSTGTIDYTPVGAETVVTWRNTGDLGMNPLSRWMGLAFDSMMGPDFEQGLDKLKTSVEAPAPNSPATAPTAK